MSNPSNRIEEQLPLHYREQAANFILFLQAYYDWLHRGSGFSYQEITDLKNDTSWISENVDLFSKTGLSNYLTQTSQEVDIDQSIIDLGKFRSAGDISDNIQDEYLLESNDEIFLTSEGEYFVDEEGIGLEINQINDEFLDSWYRSSNFVRSESKGLDRVDEVLLVSLLKHIHNIKGTEQSIRLFFSIFFNENNIELYIPKFDIAIIDDNFIPDVKGIIRDDNYYDEYSYVIRLENDPSYYESLFNDIFMKYIHPAGFSVFLEKKI